jgi:hypothetical protein
MDFSWARGPAETINVSARAGQLIHTIPAHQRLYLGNLLDIVNTSYNTNYIARWTAHYGSLAGENYSGILTYIGQRAASVRRQLPPPAAFRITSFSGQDFTTNSSSVVLRGTAPYTFKQLQRNDDSPGAGFTWPAVETWETTVSLQPGPNRVSITGYDFHGNALATNSITITLADPAKPDQDGDGMPDEWERLYALNPGVPDGTVDSDGDGLSNLAEYIAGTSPIDARSGLRVEITRSDAMQFMLQFPAVKGRTYRFAADPCCCGGPVVRHSTDDYSGSQFALLPRPR